MKTHAIFSPSSAYRWINCPASAKLNAKYDDKPSAASIQGTKAHAVAEECLTKGIEATGTKCSRAMAAHVQRYLNYISELKHENSEVHVEKKLDFSNYVPKGFGTADCIIINDKSAHLIDLKYGRGLVYATNNQQLMLYALGLLCWKPLIRSVTLHIAQPRVNNFNSCNYSIDEIVNFGVHAGKAAQQGLSLDPPFLRGSHCRYCKHINDCTETRYEYIDDGELFHDDTKFVGSKVDIDWGYDDKN